MMAPRALKINSETPYSGCGRTLWSEMHKALKQQKPPYLAVSILRELHIHWLIGIDIAVTEDEIPFRFLHDEQQEALLNSAAFDLSRVFLPAFSCIIFRTTPARMDAYDAGVYLLLSQGYFVH